METGNELVHLIDACSGLSPNYNDFCALLNLIALLRILFNDFVFAHHGPHRLRTCLLLNQLLFGSKVSIHMEVTIF